MSKVYRIKPLEKKSISWEVEMYRENADGTISWFNVSDHYRWGQGFIDEELDCNLPLEGDEKAYAKIDVGFGADLEDQVACWFEFSEDISEEEQEEIKRCYLEGDGDEEWERSGAAWLFDAEHDWQCEDDYVIILGPYQVDLCEDDGTILEENIKLKTREQLAEEVKQWQAKNKWPFDTAINDSEGGEAD